MCAYYLWITLNNIFIAFVCILFLFSIMAHQPILYQFRKQQVAHISIISVLWYVIAKMTAPENGAFF